MSLCIGFREAKVISIAMSPFVDLLNASCSMAHEVQGSLTRLPECLVFLVSFQLLLSTTPLTDSVPSQIARRNELQVLTLYIVKTVLTLTNTFKPIVVETRIRHQPDGAFFAQVVSVTRRSIAIPVDSTARLVS